MGKAEKIRRHSVSLPIDISDKLEECRLLNPEFCLSRFVAEIINKHFEEIKAFQEWKDSRKG